MQYMQDKYNSESLSVDGISLENLEVQPRPGTGTHNRHDDNEKNEPIKSSQRVYDGQSALGICSQR